VETIEKARQKVEDTPLCRIMGRIIIMPHDETERFIPVAHAARTKEL
jgi:hypothetical protein